MNFTSYKEYGFHPIPINCHAGDEKRPSITGWQRQFDLPEETLAEWDALLFQSDWKKRKGIGVLLGARAGIIALDIDIADLTDPIYQFLPNSNFKKRGKRGETRFFSYSEGFLSKQIFHYFGEKIEVLSGGQQTVMPPTQFEVGTEYRFIDCELKSLDELRLPVLTKIDIESAIKKASGLDYQIPVPTQLLGRFEYLKRVGLACAYKQMNAQEIQIELEKTDLLKFQSSYFAEHKSNPAHKMAKGIHRFAQSVLGIQIEGGFEISDKFLQEYKAKKEEEIEYPKPPKGSSLEAVYNFGELMFPFVPKALLLKTAIDVVAILSIGALEGRTVSRKFWPKFATLGIAPPSAGKSTAMDIVTTILSHEVLKERNLQGLSNYSSVPAFAAALPTQRARLDMFDEFRSVLETMDRKDSHARAIVPLLNEWISKDIFDYSGYRTATDGLRYAVRTPCVNLTAGIQPEIFEKTVGETLLQDGFLNRFLFFAVQKTLEVPESIPSFQFDQALNLLCSVLKQNHPSPVLSPASATEISEDISHYFFQPNRMVQIPHAIENRSLRLLKEFSNTHAKKDSDRYYLERAQMLALRLTVLVADAGPRCSVATEAHLEFSLNVIKSSFLAFQRLTDSVLGKGPDAISERIIDFLKRAPEGAIFRAEDIRTLFQCPVSLFSRLIKDAEFLSIIETSKDVHGQKTIKRR
jgi:hypothetical protein